MRKAAVLFLLFAVSGYAEDFSLSRDGIGPISVHTVLTYKGKGEHLSARGVNDSDKPIPYVKLCVTAETKGCLFTLWNTSTWQPGAELNWDMDSTRKVRNLSHEVSIAPAAGTTTSPVPVERPSKLPKPGPVLEHGVVLSQEITATRNGVYAAPIGTAAIAVPIYGRSNVVVIETESTQYTWSEATRRGTIVLTVNAPVEFYRDGNWFIVLDSKGRKHRFALIGASARVK